MLALGLTESRSASTLIKRGLNGTVRARVRVLGPSLAEGSDRSAPVCEVGRPRGAVDCLMLGRS